MRFKDIEDKTMKGDTTDSSRCARQHNYGKCPTYEIRFRLCPGMNYFAASCKKTLQDNSKSSAYYNSFKDRKTNNCNNKIASNKK